MTSRRPIIAMVLLGIVSPASFSEGFSRNLIGIHLSQLSSDRCYLSRTCCGRSVRRHRFLSRRWDMMGSSSSAKLWIPTGRVACVGRAWGAESTGRLCVAMSASDAERVVDSQALIASQPQNCY